MCLIVLAYKVHSEFPLIVAANRDEFTDRPALPAQYWPDAPDILAGRDLKAGGTWLGLSTKGRFAALTNYRDMRRPRFIGPSRGHLVRSALEADFALPDTTLFEGFNLIHGSVDALRYHNNVDGTDRALAPGIYGLSNHLLDTPWPKVVRARDGMRRFLQQGTLSSFDDLFTLLGDIQQGPEDELPDTGIGLERERALSSIRIDMDGYGTRCSTVLSMDRGGTVDFEERTMHPVGERRYQLSFGRAN